MNQNGKVIKKLRSDCKVRSNLFYKLGISHQEKRTSARELSRDSLLRKVKIIREPLKYDTPLDRCTSDNRNAGPLIEALRHSEFFGVNASPTGSDIRQKRKLSFNDTVTVVPIPMRGEYSYRIREHLWYDAQEMMENVQRNTIEFLSEGWDWRNVIEDENMYICSQSGKRIHPVHVHAQN